MSTWIIPTTSSHPYFAILSGGCCDGMRQQFETRAQAQKYAREAVESGDCDGFDIKCVPRADRTTDA